MGIMFTGTELIDIAVGIEKNGVAFYETLAELAEEASAQSTYKNLAEMERRHISIFENMRGALSGYSPEVEYDENYELYLKGLVNSSVFTHDEAARDMARTVKDKSQALRIAIWAEKDSILFYHEMRSLVAPSERPMIDTIITEEKSHVRDLSQMRDNILGR